MRKALYDCVDKYQVTAVCAGPMHVGSAEEKGEILLHPVESIPMIQASSICGALRNYCAKTFGEASAKVVFGDIEDEKESKLKCTDGAFEQNDKLKIELRPRISLDGTTGTMKSSALKGSADKASGNKFEMQYVAAGAAFTFDLYLYGATKEENILVQKALAAMDAGEIQLGGQKSNGCGYVAVEEVLHKNYDMKKQEDRVLWKDEAGLSKILLPELKSEDYLKKYRIIIQAETEGELLIKGIAVDNFEKGDAKAVPMKNARQEYLIPASSFKGAIRNRMEMIAKYMNIDPSLIFDGFGRAVENETEGRIGNLYFLDTVIQGDDGQNHALRTRIHIDKLTGGVIHGGLFSELNVYGKVSLSVEIMDRYHAEAVAGLLMLALRDLAYKMYGIGSGQNVGKGYLNIENICMMDMKKGTQCNLNKNFDIAGDKSILQSCMDALAQVVSE